MGEIEGGMVGRNLVAQRRQLGEIDACGVSRQLCASCVSSR